MGDLIQRFPNGWPQDWIDRFPILASISFPSIVESRKDEGCWDLDVHGAAEFSVQRAYGSFIGVLLIVPWYRSVWFKGHIPKHSFRLWLACLQRHPTQDRISTWKSVPPDFNSLCKVCLDSHNHLFFECTYAKHVWMDVLRKLHWTLVAFSWDDIMEVISDPITAPSTFKHKIALAAAVYMVWRERNDRIFSTTSRTANQLVKSILSIVYDRTAWNQRRSKKIVKHVVPT